MFVAFRSDDNRVCPAIDYATSSTDSTTTGFQCTDYASSTTSSTTTSFRTTTGWAYIVAGDQRTCAGRGYATFRWSYNTASGRNFTSACWSNATSGSHAPTGGNRTAICRSYIAASGKQFKRPAGTKPKCSANAKSKCPRPVPATSELAAV
jgi:hypothetical protein